MVTSPKDSPVVASGKAVITGGTQPEDAEVAIDTIISRLDDLGLWY